MHNVPYYDLISGTLAILLLTVFIILPGVILTVFFRNQRLPVFTVIILGYGWLIGFITLARLFELSSLHATGIYLTSLIALLLFAFARSFSHGTRRGFPSRGLKRAVAAPIFLAVGVGVVAYLVYAGPYELLPIDYYRHLEHFRAQYDQFDSGIFGLPVAGEYLFEKRGRTWYLIHGWIASIIGSPPHILAPAFSVFHLTVLALVVAAFSIHQFSGLRLRSTLKWAAVFVSVLFFFLHFGHSTRAYVRMFSIAPTIAAYAIYLAALVIFVDYLKNKRGHWALAVVIVGVGVAQVLHTQEALFLVSMAGVVSFLLALECLRQGKMVGLKWWSPWVERGSRRVMVSVSGFALGSAGFWTWSYLSRPRSLPREPWIIPVENILPFFQNLYILNPTHQFYFILTVWGICVVVLSLFWIRELRSAVILRAGLVSPLFLGFNPFFVDLFLRHHSAVVLWRTAFIIPLFALGAWLFIRALSRIANGGGIVARIPHVAITVGLILFLVPFQTTYFANQVGRAVSLSPLPIEKTWRHWGDLVEFLSSLDERRRVVTDPLTGYLVSATTQHYRSGFKDFYHRALLVNRPNLNIEDFYRNEGALLIVNLREGGHGERPDFPNRLSIKGYYSERFFEIVESDQTFFRKIWDADQIIVYDLGGYKK